MKKIFLLGAFALLSSTIFSCTADDIQADTKTTGISQVKNNINSEVVETEQANVEDGPGDQPVIIYPPKK
jgi:hypothetical protein